MSRIFPLRSLCKVFGLLLFLGAQSAVAGLAQPTAKLFDSDLSNPSLVAKTRSLTDLISENALEGKFVTVKNASGDSCTIQSSQPDWSVGASKECLLALQVYYSGNKAAKFFHSVGIKIPLPVEIRIQDPSTKPYAQAGSTGISFSQFKDDELLGMLPLIADITFHEMTHVAQSLQEQKNEMIFGKLGTTFVEGYANLFAYLLSGRTDLGVDASGRPGMKAYSSTWFGRIDGGRYDSIEPLTSVLVDLHKRLDAQAGQAGRTQTLLGFSRALMKSFYELNRKSGFVDYFTSVNRQLEAESFAIPKDQVKKLLAILLAARGFNVAHIQTDGQTSGFLVNGLPLSASYIEKQDRVQQVSIPQFQAQPGMLLDSSIRWPIRVLLFEASSFQKLGPCMNEEMQRLPTQSRIDPHLVDKLQMICLRKITGPEITVGSKVFSQLEFVIEKPGEVLSPQMRTGAGNCGSLPQASSLLAWAFDDSGKKIGEFGLPILCK